MEHNSSSYQDVAPAGLVADRQARIVAVLPCHNRDRFIGSVLIKLQHYVDQVIVVNDGSTDQTGAVARQAGAEVIEYLTRQRPGVALEHGLAHALDLGADVLVLIEDDAQMIPEQVPLVLQPILQAGADMVVGTPLQQSRRSAAARRLSIRMGRGVPAPLTGGGLRAFTKTALAACGMLPAPFGETIGPGINGRGLRALEVPISRPEDAAPVARRSQWPRHLATRLLGTAGPVRLLLLLAACGLLLTALGIVFWYQTVQIFEARSQLALGHALLGTLAVTVGIMIAFEALTLHVIRRLVDAPRSRVREP